VRCVSTREKAQKRPREAQAPPAGATGGKRGGARRIGAARARGCARRERKRAGKRAAHLLRVDARRKQLGKRAAQQEAAHAAQRPAAAQRVQHRRARACAVA
jgi:hypothetical protein